MGNEKVAKEISAAKESGAKLRAQAATALIHATRDLRTADGKVKAAELKAEQLKSTTKTKAAKEVAEAKAAEHRIREGLAQTIEQLRVSNAREAEEAATAARTNQIASQFH